MSANTSVQRLVRLALSGSSNETPFGFSKLFRSCRRDRQSGIRRSELGRQNPNRRFSRLSNCDRIVLPFESGQTPGDLIFPNRDRPGIDIDRQTSDSILDCRLTGVRNDHFISLSNPYLVSGHFRRRPVGRLSSRVDHGVAQSGCGSGSIRQSEAIERRKHFADPAIQQCAVIEVGKEQIFQKTEWLDQNPEQKNSDRTQCSASRERFVSACGTAYPAKFCKAG